MIDSNDDRPSLLLVDDDAILRERRACALRARGFDVTVALSPGEAAILASASPPRLAVIDLKRPDGPGRELVSTLLRLDSNTKIVILAANGAGASAVEAIDLGTPLHLSGSPNGDDTVEAFEREGVASGATPAEKPMSLQRVTWEHIERVLRQHKGNVSATARALSMHRRTLQRKLTKRQTRS